MSRDRRPVLAFALGLMLAGCSAAEGSPGASVSMATPSAQAKTSDGGTPGPTIVPSPSVANAPPSLAPVPGPGEVAELALRYSACDIGCHADPGLVVLKDGRVIRAGEDGPTERSLTPLGMQQLRDALDATGLFDRDGAYEPKLNPGREASGFGPLRLGFWVASGDRTVHVTTSAGPYEEDNARQGNVWTIPPEAPVLYDVADKLGDLDAWLPESAWAGPARTFTADRFLLIVTHERVGGEGPPRDWLDVDEVAWPFAGRIEEVGAPFDWPVSGDGQSRCLVIDRQQAERMAAAVAAVSDGDEPSLGFFEDRTYRWPRGHGTVTVATRAVLPTEVPTCLGVGAW